MAKCPKCGYEAGTTTPTGEPRQAPRKVTGTVGKPVKSPAATAAKLRPRFRTTGTVGPAIKGGASKVAGMMPSRSPKPVMKPEQTREKNRALRGYLKKRKAY